MKVVQPIRDLKKIEKMKSILKEKFSKRDYLLFLLGINLGRRISDILKLKVSDLRDKDYFMINENKTGKVIRLPINQQLKQEIKQYTKDMMPDDYLFVSQKGVNQPIQRCQAYRILSDAAQQCKLKEIGTHTLRKTFGYHFYQKTKNIAVLMIIFNHDSQKDTLRYIGVEQDNIDEEMEGFCL